MEKKQRKILIILILVLTAIDQILKITILVSNIKIGNIYGWSIGVLSSTKSDNNIQYILIAVIAIILIVRYITSTNTYIKMDSKVILSFTIAGAISNTIDRAWNGATINYINISKFTALNLGYMYFIVTWIGMAVILTKYTGERIKEKNEKRNNSK